MVDLLHEVNYVALFCSVKC